MKIIYTFMLLCFAITSQSQSIDTSAISNSGGSNSNTSHSITFTIGETIIGTITNSESIDQGFWSGIASLNVLSTEEFQFSNSAISIYPNPVLDFFTIRIPDINSYTISLFNLNGQEIIHQKINTSLVDNRIDISSLSQGVYLLKLSIPTTNENKTFKIIKK
ncbi:T9SS type A sorting domain-containing protein [uncultured Aquimarina sp.]|uniref:T9SS type A sorting domain-containing protein n=1 Tax=uncultured Aquimarina sp. TaxID=575652 RepID=UPI002606961B|nr:T9SS type A sorting domain-containing protein [uncultured Aquimarina sp.]